MKLAHLSGTHGLLSPEVLELLRQKDAILHSGDVNRREIAMMMSEITDGKLGKLSVEKIAIPHDGCKR